MILLWLLLLLVNSMLINTQETPSKAEEKTVYTTKWDHVNVDQILSSDRLLKNYANCLLDKGSCTPDGNELKNILPDALATDCKKCTENQKKGAEKVIQFLIKQKSGVFKELEKKYDPNMIYRKKYSKYFQQ